MVVVDGEAKVATSIRLTGKISIIRSSLTSGIWVTANAISLAPSTFLSIFISNDHYCRKLLGRLKTELTILHFLSLIAKNWYYMLSRGCYGTVCE